MSDLIKRSDAIEAIEDKVNGSDNRIWLKEIISEIPSADRPQKVIAQVTFDEEKLREIVKEAVERFKEEYEVADRPQGEWVWHEDEDICNCSECEFEIDATGCIEPMEYVGVFHYCPNCGARMKGADDEL